MVPQVCRVKERIVAADPLEKGIRKALNLGHTIGHAVESLMMRRDKKNDGAGINFTLLRSPGDFLINSIATDEELTSALDIYRDLTGI